VNSGLPGTLIWRADDGTERHWLLDGVEIVQQGDGGQVNTAWHIRGAGDFHGDGHADIPWRHDTTGEVHA
jgi:hypothetical protein